MKKRTPYLIEGISIADFAAEGVSVARYDGKVIFVKSVVPGDVADIKVYREKKNYAEASLVRLIHPSAKRTQPFCLHFGQCGGCKWQHVLYNEQLLFKQKQVTEQLVHVGKLDILTPRPIMSSAKTTHYRNKLEFSFSHKKWLTQEEMLQGVIPQPALGFHVPGRFDKILDIQSCYLQDELSNQMRNFIRTYAITHQLSFYDIRQQEGLLRNVIFRNNRRGEWMIVLILGVDIPDMAIDMMKSLADAFPQIVSLHYVLNTKKNDSIHDLPVHLYKGMPFLTEMIDNLTFQIRPKSFFQTNTLQAELLYQAVSNLADIRNDETVYDLYTGTGTIACYVARRAKHVVGVEYVQDAIDDACENAKLNGIANISFYAGDMKDVFTPTLFEKHGKPDVVITDPPRAGMHAGVIHILNQSGASRIVYVSCNPATQARDLSFLTQYYHIEAVQPVDMFPHSHHVENIVLLTKKLK